MTNLSINEIKLLAELRNVDSHENVWRKQLESIFTIPPESISESKSDSKTKKKTVSKAN